MSTPTPIPGDQLRVGDVFLSRVGRRMKVERITLRTRPGYVNEPLFIAHGPTEIPGFTHIPNDWTETCYGDEWVVVER